MPKDEDLSELPPGERLKRYRKRALEVRRVAAATNSPDLQKSYLTIAGYWEALAELLERTMRPQAVILGADHPDPDRPNTNCPKE